MRGKEMRSIMRRNNDKKPINPIVLCLAFLLGAVTAFAVFWRIRASKNKKDADASGEAVDCDCEQEDRELEELLKKLRKENERMMWPEHEVRRPAYIQTEQVKPYRPRKRVSAKKIFVRATAAVAAAALVVTGLAVAPLDRVPASTVLAKESFGGIKQVVEEHDEDNPFVILDIVPGMAYTLINDTRYEFSLGTIGYLAPGQLSIQQDLVHIYTGDDKESFYDYTNRKELTDSVIGDGDSGIIYQEAYDGTGEDLKASEWSLIFDPVPAEELEYDEESGKLTTEVPTGKLFARVQGRGRPDSDAETGDLPVREGFDYDLIGDFSESAINLSPVDGIYTFVEGGEGDYEVIFEKGSEMSMSGYRPEKIKSGSSYEDFEGSYSDATGVYTFEDGEYRYKGTIGELKDKEESEGTSVEKDPPEETEKETEEEPEKKPEEETEKKPEEETEKKPEEETEKKPEEETEKKPEEETEKKPEEETEDKPDKEIGGETGTGGTGTEGTGTGETGSEPGGEARKETDSRWYLCVNEEDLSDSADSEEKSENPQADSKMPEGDTYYVLKFEFTYVETEEEQLLYQISGEPRLISTEGDDPRPYDSYVLETGNDLPSNSLYAVGETDTDDALDDALDDESSPVFVYVGGGKGHYKLTRVRSMEKTAAVSDTEAPDEEVLDEEDADEEDTVQDKNARAAENVFVGNVEVQNAPVYIKCTGTDKEEWLERYVFNSRPQQDNDSDAFAIRVETVLAGDPKLHEMIEKADLIYLEDSAGLYLASDVKKSYIYPETAGNVGTRPADRPADISDEAIWSLLYAAVEESKPVIVDYGVTEDQEYKDSKYQKLAKVFLKNNLDAYYYEFNQSSKFADDILMNVDSEKYANKTDNKYHYVNRNIYIASGVGGTPLVAEDFPAEMSKEEVKAGFTEVLAAIRAENVMLPEDKRISEKISKAMAVQYIINYSLGVIGEYKDLSILELQPTANTRSDLRRDSDGVVLYWQREDGKGLQILRSSKRIETNVTLSSVAAFNTSHQDINEDFNMIFIGLDGQRLYHDDDKMETVYNDGENLNGKVYHTGDRVGDTRYDANDITKQKKEELLDYLRAGYPIVVENECFKGWSARKADKEDINTDRIGEDTQMYAFLEEAISMHKKNQTGDEEESESGIGLYTIEDVHSSAMFMMQLTALRPKIEILRERKGDGTDAGASDGWNVVPSDEDEDMVVVSYDISDTEEITDKPGFTRGTIRYRVPNDKNYEWNLAKHLYLDLNYDGIFAPEEEFTGYQYEQTEDGGWISVDFKEISFGFVPWKLEVTVLNDDDNENKYRRASAQGCFTIRGKDEAKIRVLQVLDDTENINANLQKQYDKYQTVSDGNDFMLAHFIDGAAETLGIEWDIKTIAPGGKNGLEEQLSKNANYLSRWDVVVLGFGESGNPGDDVVTTAVKEYITSGGSVLVSSAGATSDRLGLSVSDLGQSDQQTYGKLASLAQNNGEKYRYDGDLSNMVDKTSGLDVDMINEGLITKRPYEIKNTISLGELTKIAAPNYLLDIGEENNTEEENQIGQAYTTAWFTLLDTDKDRNGGYSISPRDGRNNYYVYSKGNVVYVGQSEYPYTYESKDGGLPDGEGKDECMIFVNALMAAYNAGVHRVQVSIVAGFNGLNKVESVTVPYDVAFREGGDTKGGILGETVDVYFRFTDNNIVIDKTADNNIAFDKTTELSFYYKNAKSADADSDADTDTSLLLPGGVINDADYTIIPDPQIWTVENNRLVEVTEGIVPGKVYRIKAPLEALQSGADQKSEICVLITNTYTRPGRIVEMLSLDSVSLNRAQMFLLE